jgi:catalase (peroxidase I)
MRQKCNELYKSSTVALKYLTEIYRNFSIIQEKELGFGCNAGLSKATALLQDVKANHATISWADIIQMAGALAVELTGGPAVDMRYGREDALDYTARVRQTGSQAAEC